MTEDEESGKAFWHGQNKDGAICLVFR